MAGTLTVLDLLRADPIPVGSAKNRGTMKLTEAQVTQQIKGWMLAKGWTAYRLQSGTVRGVTQGTYITLNPAGTPDWLFVRGADILFVEMKATGKKLNPKQVLWMVVALTSGTPATWADSLETFIGNYRLEYEN